MTRLLRVARPAADQEGRSRRMAAGPDTDTDTKEAAAPEAGSPRWHPVTRVAFRFGLVYVALFFLTEMRIGYPLLGVFGDELPTGALTWQYHLVEPVVVRVGDLIGVDASLIEPVQSGDQRFFWVLALCWFLGALLAAATWSLVDRARRHDADLHKWFVVVVRFCLAAQLFSFGFAKVFPLQMSQPLTRLVEPYGEFGMLNVLWSQVGSSPPYEMLLGCAEVTAAVLLVIPRTALLGALLAAVELTQVLLLNITYQVPLKIFSFHLLVLSLILLAPHAVRLARFFVTDRPADPPVRRALFRSRRALSAALAAQLLLGAWLAGSQVREEWKLWDTIGSSAPKPPLYGIWEVRAFSLDGRERPPLTTDTERWNRLIVDTPHSYQPGSVSSQRMDGTIVDYAAAFDPKTGAMTLARPDDPAWSARLTFAQPAPDRLTMRGVLAGQRVSIRLEKTDLSSFPINRDSPRWVQDGPYQPRLEG
ncbi:DoxX family protein [Streptomyces griseus]|uniref:DoxX family protein n=1 Tax=Streptomyces griseus TaxID=1911 RepID=UPI00381D2AD2